MPDWADPKARREALRDWSIKQRQDREHPSWKAARQRWELDAAVEADKLPAHISNLMRQVATSDAPPKPEVIAEIQRRLAAHYAKEG